MARRLSVATFNLLNLSEPGQATRPGSTPLTGDEYARKTAWVGERLRKLDADVIGFQELWSPKALQDAFAAGGLDGAYEVVGRPAPFGRVQVALAVRAGWRRGEPVWHEAFPPGLVLRKRPPGAGAPVEAVSVEIGEFSRPVLEVRVKPRTGPELRAFVAHLKSKLPMRLDRPEQGDPAVAAHAATLGSALSTIRRTAEAAALRVLLDGAMRDNAAPVVVMGDINDGHLSTTVSLLTAEPPLKLFAASKTATRPGRGLDVGLYPVQLLQELRSLRDVYYTYVHEGLHESLDHILVSEQFYDHSPGRVWSFNEMRVFNDHLHEGSEEERTRTDHGIVVARFDHNPAPPVAPAPGG